MARWQQSLWNRTRWLAPASVETGEVRAQFEAHRIDGGAALVNVAGRRAPEPAVIAFTRRKALRDAAGRAYRRVVEQARQPVFFAAFGVPDTLDGRFELICLHAFLYLHRLKSEPRAAEVAQLFFDTMFADMDRGLREMGTGDLSVGRHVKRMAQGFYGRIRAYQTGLERNRRELSAALARNLYGTVGESPTAVAAMADYVRAAAKLLAEQPAAELIEGNIVFPPLGRICPGIAAPSGAGAQ